MILRGWLVSEEDRVIQCDIGAHGFGIFAMKDIEVGGFISYIGEANLTYIQVQEMVYKRRGPTRRLPS